MCRRGRVADGAGEAVAERPVRSDDLERVKRDEACFAISVLAEDRAARQMILPNQLELGRNVERNVLELPCKQGFEKQRCLQLVVMNPGNDFFTGNAVFGKDRFHVKIATEYERVA